MSVFDDELYEAYARLRKPLPKRARQSVSPRAGGSSIQPRAQKPAVDPVEALILAALEEPGESLTSPTAEDQAKEPRPKKVLRLRNKGPIFGTPVPSFQFGHQASTSFTFDALSAALEEVEQENKPVTSPTKSETPPEDEEDDLYIPPETTGPLTQAEQDTLDALDRLLAYPPMPPPPPRAISSPPTQPLDFPAFDPSQPPERRRADAGDVKPATSLPEDPEFKEVKLAAQAWKPGTISPLFKRQANVPQAEGKSSESPLPKREALVLKDDEELLWTDEDSDDEDDEVTPTSRSPANLFGGVQKDTETGAGSLNVSLVRSTAVGDNDDEAVWNRSVMKEAE
ncbi:hypothetical protein CALCODRAFT_515345 [Calocera cornea HHB12733]|uniref:Uncharacterized protein n=1 Tax=Calocera cornea HHB12733 TaxID=1353952 RepID=A0A165IH97_9BASI|nr:hypothetical protein CALCODRAFT_515345 [Calocera cornea HHB12733]